MNLFVSLDRGFQMKSKIFQDKQDTYLYGIEITLSQEEQVPANWK